MKFLVIKGSFFKICKDGNIEIGNMADEDGYLIKHNDKFKFIPATWDEKVDALLEGNAHIKGTILCPVFRPFEVVIVDDDLIEIPYPHRKVYKWAVTYEVFDNLEEAMKRSAELGEKFFDGEVDFYKRRKR